MLGVAAGAGGAPADEFVLGRADGYIGVLTRDLLPYADECCRMLTYADVC